MLYYIINVTKSRLEGFTVLIYTFKTAFFSPAYDLQDRKLFLFGIVKSIVLSLNSHFN
jgi:hypothetical protein